MQNGATPLFIAAQKGHLETCRELIERGASIDLPFQVRIMVTFSKTILQESGRTSLKKVLENARLKRFKFLLFCRS